MGEKSARTPFRTVGQALVDCGCLYANESQTRPNQERADKPEGEKKDLCFQKLSRLTALAALVDCLKGAPGYFTRES